MLEPVDNGDLKSPGLVARAGSNPAPGTKTIALLGSHGQGSVAFVYVWMSLL